MIQKKASPTLLHASSKVAAASLITRLLGMVRDIMVAHVFGISSALDAFFIAFKIPNFLRRLFAEGAFAQGLVPALAQSSQPQQLFASLLTGTVLIGALCTVLVEIFAPWWMRLTAPGFTHDPAQFALAVSLCRITFPFLFFVLITALAAAALNARYYFGWPMLAPLWLNLTTLIAVIVVAPHVRHPINALAWSITVGGLIQVLFLWPIVTHAGWSWRWGPISASSAMWRVMRNTLPGIIGVSIWQMGVLLDVILATFLPSGSVSLLFFADRLVSFPTALISVAVSSAILPLLSRAKLSIDREHTLQMGLHLVLLLGLPATVGLVMLAGPITATLLQSGHFSAQAVMKGQTCLAIFAGGLPAVMLIKILVSAHNAAQRYTMPFILALVALGVNVGLGLWWMPHYAHVGLAMATTVAAWVNAVCVIVLSYIAGKLQWCRVVNKVALQASTAAAVMGLSLYYFTPVLNVWLVWPYFTRWGYLLILILSALLVYIAVLFLLGWRPWYGQSTT